MVDRSACSTPWSRPIEGVDLVDVDADLGLLTTDGFVSTAGIAAVAAMLTAAAPWLGRRWRRAGWALIVGLVITAFIQAPVSFDADAGRGPSAGSAAPRVLVVARRTVAAADACRRSSTGSPPSVCPCSGSTGPASTPADRRRTSASAPTAPKLFVKALGDDERSADLLFRLYRGLLPHNFGDEKPFNSLRRSRRARGVRRPRPRPPSACARPRCARSPRPTRTATSSPTTRSRAGRSIASTRPRSPTTCWPRSGISSVNCASHRIAHRDLRLANIFLDDDGEAWLIDFGFSEVAASDLLLATDVAELVASSSVYVGPERAVAHAARTVDRGDAGRAADRLHPWASAARRGRPSRPGRPPRRPPQAG